MTTLILGLALFFGIHLLPSAPLVRQSLLTRLGEGPYKGLYSVISLLGFILIVLGMAAADFRSLWLPPSWAHSVVVPLMLPSFILLAAANMPGNIKRFCRHPMLWGVTLWAAGHLLANGDLASILLFGAFALFSLFDIVSVNRRGAQPQQQTLPLSKDLMVVAVGSGAYVFFLLLHPTLFGVAVV